MRKKPTALATYRHRHPTPSIQPGIGLWQTRIYRVTVTDVQYPYQQMTTPCPHCIGMTVFRTLTWSETSETRNMLQEPLPSATSPREFGTPSKQAYRYEPTDEQQDSLETCRQEKSSLKLKLQFYRLKCAKKKNRGKVKHVESNFLTRRGES